MDEQLRDKLQKLHDDLGIVEPGDADAKTRVQDVRNDVQAALEGGADEHRSLLERLRNAIPVFESTHPSLTLAISEVVDDLARMGV